MARSGVRSMREMILKLAADQASGWELVPESYGLTIRRISEHKTPEANRAKPGEPAGFGTWDQDTYHSLVFITLVAGKVILGYSSAPWMRRTDSHITFWLAEAILADHTLAGDYTRINAMRRNRRR